MKLPRKVKNLIAVFLVLLFAAVAAAARPPRRIVSLSPALTEEVYLLGAQDKIVGTTVYCIRPPEAKKKGKVGTVTKANLEKIVALRPDLVLATSLSDARQMRKLRNLGINVVTFSDQKDFSGICREFIRLSELIGKRKEAEDIVKRAKNRVESIKHRTKDLSKQRVFVQIGAKPLFAATKDYSISDFIEFAGGINIAEEAKSGLYSREKVLRSDPDVIIVTAMGVAGEEERAAWQRYKSLKAAKNNRIYVVEPYRFCSPTPVSFVAALEEMVGILHGER